MLRPKLAHFILILCFVSNFIIFAADFSQSSVTILSGSNFELGNDRRRTELTYESLNIFSYGDSFFWLDVTSPFKKIDSDRNTNLYGEWSPRISFAKLFSLKRDGIIKDFTFSNTFEFGNNNIAQTRAHLHGLGLDFNIPGFRLFSLNFYVRDNLDQEGTTFQSTMVYIYPFKISSLNFLINAYVDVIYENEGKGSTKREAHWHTAQQLHYYILKNLSVGFEYQYWSQKFGIVGAPSESNLKILAQWIF